MRRNDFFKYLLLGGGGSASRSELESETLPYAFTSNSYKLRNYRIYGAEGGVGDSVSSGEHSGEYLVPVTVEGKNLLQNTATSLTKNGVTFTVNADKSITCNGTTTNTLYFAVKDNVVLESGTYVLTGCPLGGGQNTFKLYAQTASGTIFYVDEGAGAIINYTSKITILITILSGYTCNNLTFYPMIRKADIEDDTYEPYHAPVTTPIYLPEPIKMVGDEAEYIDYAEQKQYFADGTSTDVTLPALPTLSGTNTLSIGTAVQPSKIWIQGNISEIETASVQALQANMRSLQPLSLDGDLQLDVMPIDRSEFQINDISEVPVEDENSVEKIPKTENFETSGDEENAK